MSLLLQATTTSCKGFSSLLNGLSSVSSLLISIVPFHKFSNIELGLLEYLDLTDVAVLHGEDRRCLAGNLFANRSRDEFLDKGLEVSLASQLTHDRGHLGTDRSRLCGLDIACVLNLVVLWAGESDAEQADNVPVGRSAINKCLNNRLLLSDQTAKLITSHVHTVKVGKAVVTLNILHTKLNLSVSDSFRLVQISETDFNNASLQTIRGDLCTLGFGDESASAILDCKDGRSDQLVPFFLQERVYRLFAASLLALCQSLVLSLLVE